MEQEKNRNWLSSCSMSVQTAAKNALLKVSFTLSYIWKYQTSAQLWTPSAASVTFSLLTLTVKL